MSFIAFIIKQVSTIASNATSQIDYEQQGQQLNSAGQGYVEQGLLSQQVYNTFCWEPNQHSDYWNSIFSFGSAQVYWDGVVDGQKR